MEAWYKRCRSHPPLHYMVAAYLGIKPEKPPAPTNADHTARLLEELQNALGNTR